ncbi:hypothetical protein [Arthrobacter sp. SLBN-100]|uniref:hypothetical protein n=1 Tax=Arthrobacter sp. SLBN-100 TaxID=2768450 RepID=UPI001F46075C|nr:hypothetical protein [Arthrobacter sp. SLBN-100]
MGLGDAFGQPARALVEGCEVARQLQEAFLVVEAVQRSVQRGEGIAFDHVALGDRYAVVVYIPG